MAELVDVTEKARQLIRKLKAKHGDLMFHQSGGCCDGSAPICLEAGELMIDDSDVLLAELEGCPFYMSAFQYKYWKHSQLTLDVAPGRGASFSLETPLGLRFITQSRLLTNEEAAQVKDA